MKDNISATQWLSMLGASVSAILMMNYIRLFVSAVGRGTYLSALLLAAFTLILLLGILALVRANDFHSPREVTAALLGERAAALLCAFAALLFFLFAAETLNIYVYIVKFYFLPRTPTTVLAIVLFLPGAYMAFCGFRTFGNIASAASLGWILFLLMFPFTKNNYLPANLMPWNDFSLSDIFATLPSHFLTAPAAAASFFALPHCTERQKLKKKALTFAVLLCLVMLFLYFAGMAYFGENVIKRLILPFYNLSPFFKGNLLERFDIIYMLALLPSLTVFNGFAFSMFALIRQESTKKGNAAHCGRRLFLFAAAVVFLSVVTVNHISLRKVYTCGNIIFLFLIGVLSLCYLGSALKKRRETP